MTDIIPVSDRARMTDALRAARALATCCMAVDCYSHEEIAELARATRPTFDAALSPEPPAREDTVAFVQHWMMSGDHAADQWHRDFAAAIDARASLSTDKERLIEALDRLYDLADGFSVSGVYFSDACFTDNVAALKAAADALQDHQS